MPLITKLQTGGRQHSGGLINHSQRCLERQRCKKSQSWHSLWDSKTTLAGAFYSLLNLAESLELIPVEDLTLLESGVRAQSRVFLEPRRQGGKEAGDCKFYPLSRPAPLSPSCCPQPGHTLDLIFLCVMATLKYLATSKYQTFEYDCGPRCRVGHSSSQSQMEDHDVADPSSLMP